MPTPDDVSDYEYPATPIERRDFDRTPRARRAVVRMRVHHNGGAKRPRQRQPVSPLKR